MAIQHFDDPDRLQAAAGSIGGVELLGMATPLGSPEHNSLVANEREHGVGSEVVGLPRNFIADPAQRRTEYLSGTENMHQHMAKLAELEIENSKPGITTLKWQGSTVINTSSLVATPRVARCGVVLGNQRQRTSQLPPPVPPRRNDPIDWEGVGSGEQED